MTNQHPITPPPELVQQWREQMPAAIFDGYKYPEREKALCFVAARWGADQELKACIELLFQDDAREFLRAARRPKQPNLKEQALTALHAVATGANDTREQYQDLDTIRRALQALDD